MQDIPSCSGLLQRLILCLFTAKSNNKFTLITLFEIEWAEFFVLIENKLRRTRHSFMSRKFTQQ